MEFIGYNLCYIDYDFKTSFKTKKSYYIYTFINKQTKRYYYLYDWQTIPFFPKLISNHYYNVSGYINSTNHSPFLVIQNLTEEET